MAKTVEPMPYSEFGETLAKGHIVKVLVLDYMTTGRLKSPGSRGKVIIVTTRVEPNLVERLSKYDVLYTRVVENTWSRDALPWVLPVMAFFGVWLFLFHRSTEKQSIGGFLNIDKSRAKVSMEKNTGMTPADVTDVGEARAELVEIVDLLKNPQEYRRLGAHTPEGVLLVGPPGTGKTLLTKAAVGEAGVPFFSISGSGFVEMFVGVGATRVRDLFEQVHGQAPAVIFIDKLDTPSRMCGIDDPTDGHDERERTPSRLLTEMNGFDSSVGLVILVATNRPEILDQVLLRTDRLDRQILVSRSDKKGRLDILKIYAKKVILVQGIDLEQVAVPTTDFSGVDFVNLVNEVVLAMTRCKAPAVKLQDFTTAIERTVVGLEKKD